MTQTPRPTSIRALGARRLTQATVAMVVVGAAGTGALIVHEAAEASASTDSSSTSTSTDTTSTDSGTTSTTQGGSSQLMDTQAAPQATSGGS